MGGIWNQTNQLSLNRDFKQHSFLIQEFLGREYAKEGSLWLLGGKLISLEPFYCWNVTELENGAEITFVLWSVFINSLKTLAKKLMANHLIVKVRHVFRVLLVDKGFGVWGTVFSTKWIDITCFLFLYY